MKHSNNIEHQISIRQFKALSLVILSSFLSAVAVQGFVETAHLYPSGFLGIAVLINRLSLKFLHFDLSFNLLYLILNLASIFLVRKVAGKKFLLYSGLQFVLVSFFITLIPRFSLVDDPLLLSLFGGVIAGFSSLLALQANASSGGMDFIAIYMSHKYNKPFWNQIMLFNILILIIAGIYFGFYDAFYSMIYQFAATYIINNLHDRYKLVSLRLITSKPEEISNLIFKMTQHGATQLYAQGAYTKEEKTMLILVCNSFEVNELASQAQLIDPQIFITVSKTEQIIGNYEQKNIE
ncbi:YitT family protein [uncultured Traorella sp.]|uniref:YitT family protein n=1 Tax=uncultured Traorella sp. TaxID=1929048 RepID=UPI0025EB722F|nr:YitT family protein [uncultured Traorella sp.]